MHVNEEQAVTAVGVAAGAFAAVRYGAMLPAVGPIQGPIGLIVLGGALTLLYKGSGTIGEAARGFGLGVVAVGVVGLVS